MPLLKQDTKILHFSERGRIAKSLIAYNYIFFIQVFVAPDE
jgi:hypothetical protein